MKCFYVLQNRRLGKHFVCNEDFKTKVDKLYTVFNRQLELRV